MELNKFDSFELIRMNKSHWEFLNHSHAGIGIYTIDFKKIFLLFDWENKFVINFDDFDTRNNILQRTIKYR